MPKEHAEYWEHWYELVDDDSLRQGDVFRDLVVFALPQDLPVPTTEPEPDEPLPIDAEWFVGDWIIMSASCDVARDATRYPWVLIGRVEATTPAALGVPEGKKFSDRVEVLKREFDPTRFLLARCPAATPPFEQSFVTFRPHLTLPFEYLKRACTSQRLRLQSPFREQFGNWVGTNISRVGIEEDAQIPRARMTLTSSKLLTASADQEPIVSAMAAGGPRKADAGSLHYRLLSWFRSLIGRS